MPHLTRQERGAMLFLIVSLFIGSLVTLYNQYRDDVIPDLAWDETSEAAHHETSDSRPQTASRYNAPSVESGTDTPVTQSASAPPDRIDINTATSARLQTLPGIGPALARRIIAYRDENGPFRSKDQLLEIKGIGPATLAKLRSRIRID